MKICNSIKRLFCVKTSTTKLPSDNHAKLLNYHYHPAEFKGRIVGKLLSGLDLKDYVYEGWRFRHDFCPVCHNTLVPTPPDNYVFRKRTGDVWVSYDGFYIVSTRFKKFCEEQGFPNLIFVPIVSSKGYFFFMTNEIFKFDHIRSDVLFITKRACCGNYDEIIGEPRFQSPIEKKDLDNFICRDEYYYGSLYNKNQIIIVGSKTQELMMQYGLSNLYFIDVYE
ncbi:MAG: hypothetical protein J5506_07835 [Prevotella sp.]|nr:hypothetical protein [Prevotella sp.]